MAQATGALQHQIKAPVGATEIAQYGFHRPSRAGRSGVSNRWLAPHRLISTTPPASAISNRENSAPVSVRLNSAFVQDAIALAEHDDAGLPVLDLMFGDMGEAHDGKDVTSFSLEGSRAVEDDLARTGISWDGVGLEAISVCLIAAQDALVTC